MKKIYKCCQTTELTYFEVIEEKLYITICSLDIFSQKIVFQTKDKNKFYFKLFGDSVCLNALKKTLSIEQKIYSLVQVNELEMTNVKKLSNVSFLKEKYVNSYDKKIDYKYCFDKSLYKELRNQIDLNINKEIPTIDKVKDILCWISSHVRHEGKSLYLKPGEKIVCYLNSKPIYLNCRGIAKLFSEIALSEGIKTKIVFMFPKIKSNNSHVVNDVYIQEINKWIMVDPMISSFFSNKENKPLSIVEVRKILSEEREQEIIIDGIYNSNKLALKPYYDSLKKNMYKFRATIVNYPGCDKYKNLIGLSPIISNGFQCDNPFVFWR